MGFSGSYRMWQLTANKIHVPIYEPDKESPMEYMVNWFIPSLRDIQKQGGHLETGKGRERIGGSLVVGFGGSVFIIYGDMQVAEPHYPFACIGSGSQIANGYLFSKFEKRGTFDEYKNPEEIVLGAVRAAGIFDAFVGPPYNVLSTI